MNDQILNSFSYSEFGLTHEDFNEINQRTVVVTKWNWDYSLCHQFQLKALRIVQASTDLRVLICCNHPEVLTHGRGLQKNKKGEKLDLVEFNPKDQNLLPYPFHQISRGGGLTFHHPGQFIFYPILKLNPTTLSLSKMMNEIFEFSEEVLKDWGLKDLHHQHKLLGLWKDNKKIASMGIAIEKLVTFHGMALNIFKNYSMMESLSKLNPCGIDSQTYAAVEDFISLPENAIEVFKIQFLKRIQDEWK